MYIKQHNNVLCIYYDFVYTVWGSPRANSCCSAPADYTDSNCGDIFDFDFGAFPPKNKIFFIQYLIISEFPKLTKNNHLVKVKWS